MCNSSHIYLDHLTPTSPFWLYMLFLIIDIFLLLYLWTHLLQLKQLSFLISLNKFSCKRKMEINKIICSNSSFHKKKYKMKVKERKRVLNKNKSFNSILNLAVKLGNFLFIYSWSRNITLKFEIILKFLFSSYSVTKVLRIGPY